MSKLKTNFILKSVKGNEKPIILVLNFGYKKFDALNEKNIYQPLRYYTGIKIHPKEWDNQNKLPLDKEKLNQLLSIEKVARDIYYYLETNNQEITPDLLKEELDKTIKGKNTENKVIRIFDYINNVILKTDTSRSASTLKQYKRLANKIEDFETRKNIKLNADTLDEKVYLEFINEARNQLGKINSVWGLNKTFKSVLNEISRKYKISVFSPSKDLSKSSKVSAVREDKIYLNFEQIEKIINYKAPNEKLQNVKLILLTLLFTGCRYSDVFKIKPDFQYSKNGIKFRYTRFISTKTSTEVLIPILKPLEDAYMENNGNSPYIISSVKFNEYVKELVEKVGLKDDVTLSFTNSFGKKEFEVKQFFRFVSSHIGRRSFITNFINYVPITILTKITGHTIKDQNIIFGYNKISLLDNAVLFVKELKRITETHKEEFPLSLI